MIWMVLMFLLVDQRLIRPVSSIQCYTCNESGHHCPMPLNLDGGDESNDNEVNSMTYNADHYCISDYSIDPRTGVEKLILHGVLTCEELDAPNHRIHCCRTNHCNKYAPKMNVQTLADIMPKEFSMDSSNERPVLSMLLLVVSVVFTKTFL